MRIVYCLPSLYNSGGMERVLSLKANYLADVLGYDVFVVLTDGKGRPSYFQMSENVKIIQLDINYDSLYGISLGRRVLGYLKKQREFKRRLEKCLFDLQPDITISMLRREINFINSMRDGSAKLGEFHFNRVNYRDFKREKTALFVKKIVARFWMNQLIRNLKKLDRFVVLTHEDEASWTELNNVGVIPNPLSFFPEQLASLDRHQVIAVGRYSYEKGYDRLLLVWKKVVEKHPDWELVIYGNGDRDELTRMAEKLEIGKTCRFEGATSDIVNRYLESSLLVSGARFEGFGMVLTEAMACGVPVVSFDCPCGPKDIIDNGDSGYLVKDGDIDSMAEKVCSLIENPALRKKMGATARQRAVRFKTENVMEQWDHLFHSLLKK